MEQIKPKCECPESRIFTPLDTLFGFDPEEEMALRHEPGKCPCTLNLRRYVRDGVTLWLCNACVGFGDEPVST